MTNALISQLTGRTVEMFSLWVDTNQRVLRELVELSAATAKEGVRLCAEVQSSAVEAMKQGQAYVLRRQDELPDAPRDPLGFYHNGVLESVETVQRTFRLLEGTTQAMTRASERLQRTADQTSKDIQATFTDLAGKMQSLYTPLA